MIHRFTPEIYYNTYGRNDPALCVKPGDTIITTTADAGGNDKNNNPIPEERRQKIPGTILNRSNPLTGPFYIEGS
jgi:acetamidase/formamidase